MNKIAITTGDLLGIGEEITIKALNALNLPKEDVLIIGKNLNPNLNVQYETLEIDPKDNGKFCFESLKTACALAQEGKIKAIVTAPVSKEALYKSGYKYSGQTEILQEFLGSSDKNSGHSDKNSGNNKDDGDISQKDISQKAEMIFISNDLRVLLLTRHLALKDVKLTKELIIEKVLRTNKFLIEKCNVQNPRFALCALNPHAGENGILGNEEKEIMVPAVKKLQALGVNITEPLSADGLFAHVGEKYLQNQKQDYDCILASYHDQGLCPVKALCFKKVVNTTIGLKVIRTSPSSGTAYDIAGKGIADETGMIEAIKLAFQLQ